MYSNTIQTFEYSNVQIYKTLTFWVFKYFREIEYFNISGAENSNIKTLKHSNFQNIQIDKHSKIHKYKGSNIRIVSMYRIEGVEKCYFHICTKFCTARCEE